MIIISSKKFQFVKLYHVSWKQIDTMRFLYLNFEKHKKKKYYFLNSNVHTGKNSPRGRGTHSELQLVYVNTYFIFRPYFASRKAIIVFFSSLIFNNTLPAHEHHRHSLMHIILISYLHYDYNIAVVIFYYYYYHHRTTLTANTLLACTD